jgi:hypothetical protein
MCVAAQGHRTRRQPGGSRRAAGPPALDRLRGEDPPAPGQPRAACPGCGGTWCRGCSCGAQALLAAAGLVAGGRASHPIMLAPALPSLLLMSVRPPLPAAGLQLDGCGACWVGHHAAAKGSIMLPDGVEGRGGGGAGAAAMVGTERRVPPRTRRRQLPPSACAPQSSTGPMHLQFKPAVCTHPRPGATRRSKARTRQRAHSPPLPRCGHQDHGLGAGCRVLSSIGVSCPSRSEGEARLLAPAPGPRPWATCCAFSERASNYCAPMSSARRPCAGVRGRRFAQPVQRTLPACNTPSSWWLPQAAT